MFFFVESPASTRVTRNSGKQPTIMSMFSKVWVYWFSIGPYTLAYTLIHFQQVKKKKNCKWKLQMYKCLYWEVNLSCSQKRKSEDLNGEATNGQNELKKEEDNVEEVVFLCTSDV